MDLQQAQELFIQAFEAYKNNDFENAIDLYSQIEKTSDDLKKIYAFSKFNLGVLCKELGRMQEAEQHYTKVLREDSVEQYLKAQVNLGNLLGSLKRFKEAETVYGHVKREDQAELYARAQLNLGKLLGDLKKYDEAIDTYTNVKRKDSAKLYAYAQWNLTFLTKKSKYFKKILLEDDLETYAEAQFELGKLLKPLPSKHKYWQKIPKETQKYKQEIYQITILNNIVQLDKSKCKNKLFQLFQTVNEILNSLFIQSKYEQFIAHYTALNVAKLFLSAKNDSKAVVFDPKSNLRLNTINLMNDPTEGMLLNQLLGLNDEIQTQDLPFISCFTLHHDSLNQFRLYGKNGDKEATGLSLIFSKDFFSTQHNIAHMLHKHEPLQHDVNDISAADQKQSLNKACLAAMPLYRCIYLDPTSGLMQVAQREEWSFHREYKAEQKNNKLEDNPSAVEKWTKYQQEINTIEQRVNQSFKSLVKQINELNFNILNDKEKELLAEILLPLRYLIKHMAFKEEQECRMIYVTQMDNPFIKYDEKINRIYIDYEPSVMEHLEKIYLAPKAKDEKMLFEYLCSRGNTVRKAKPPVKVKISQNPFR